MSFTKMAWSGNICRFFKPNTSINCVSNCCNSKINCESIDKPNTDTSPKLINNILCCYRTIATNNNGEKKTRKKEKYI